VKLVVAGDHHDVGLRRRLIAVVEDRQPRVGDVAVDRRRADHISTGPVAGPGSSGELTELVLDRRADRHDLLERGPEPERPQLAHVLLG